MILRFLAASAALFLIGCWPFPQGFVHDETLVGPYRLVAVDTMEDMGLCRSIGDDGDCVGDGLPGETIFSAGADDQHIVLARHPRGQITVGSGNEQTSVPTGPVDRSITEYYYVIRTVDEAERGPYGSVRGPFSAQQFEREKARLGLPAFSRTFEELR